MKRLKHIAYPFFLLRSCISIPIDVVGSSKSQDHRQTTCEFNISNQIYLGSLFCLFTISLVNLFPRCRPCLPRYSSRSMSEANRVIFRPKTDSLVQIKYSNQPKTQDAKKQQVASVLVVSPPPVPRYQSHCHVPALLSLFLSGNPCRFADAMNIMIYRPVCRPVL